MIDEGIDTSTAEQLQAPDYVYIDASYHPLYVTLIKETSRRGETDRLLKR